LCDRRIRSPHVPRDIRAGIGSAAVDPGTRDDIRATHAARAWPPAVHPTHGNIRLSARRIRHPCLSLTATATPAGARSTAGATDTTVGPDEVIVRIDLVRLGAGFRGRANLPRGAIDVGLALIAALLISAANQRWLAIAVVCAMRLDRKLTHRQLVAGNDAALFCWAVC
jgi:hypothetical protein